MLDDLDTIDWGNLSHAYGEATEVPDLIRALASEDEEIREEAISELYGNIYHQGTVYEATSHAVPFLIELLEEDSVSKKDNILGLLHVIANGLSYLDAHKNIDSVRAGHSRKSFLSDLAQELEHVRQAREAVVAGTTVYLGLLGDEKADVRISAAHTLAICHEQSDVVQAAVWERFAAEGDDRVKASMILCLWDLWRHRAHPSAELSRPDEIQLRRVLDVMRSERETALVRFTAAVTIAGWLHQKDRDEALSLAAHLAEAAWRGFSGLPWSVQASSPIEVMTSGLSHKSGLRLSFLLTLLRSPAREIRTDVIYELGNLCQERRSPSTRVAPVLGELLSDDDIEVREWAASTLAKIGSAARLATEPLMAALDDSSVCGSAAIALAKVGEVRAIPRIRNMLADEETSMIALKALTKFGTAASEAIPDLRAMLQNPPTIQYPPKRPNPDDVLRALGAIDGGGRVSFADVEAMLKGPFASTANWVLNKWGRPVRDVVPRLIPALDSPIDFVRHIAARALSDMGEAAADAVPRLTQLLDASDPELRALSAKALWQIERSELSVPALIGVIEKEFTSQMADSHRACSEAAECLGEMETGAMAACSILRKAMKHESKWVRVKASCALWRITRTTDEVLPLLLKELKGDSAWGLILECLGEMGAAGAPAIPKLRRIIKSENRLVTSGSIDEIVDNDEAFREAAEKALKRILDERE